MNWYKKAQNVSPLEIKRIQELSKAIDKAYENNQLDKIEDMEEELENLIENATNKQEEINTEGYDIEGQGQDESESASLEELLAKLYHQYITFNVNIGPFNSKEDIIENMKSNVVMFGGNPDIKNDVVMNAAKDAYNRKINLRKKYKAAQNIIKMNWYKKAQKQYLGYKIVGYNGKYAYSIYDIKHIIPLNINQTISNPKGIYLGNSKDYVINYFSGGTNDKDLLLTYQYNHEDIIGGEPEYQNGEIIVKKATLIKVEEVKNELV